MSPLVNLELRSFADPQVQPSFSSGFRLFYISFLTGEILILVLITSFETVCVSFYHSFPPPQHVYKSFTMLCVWCSLLLHSWCSFISFVKNVLTRPSISNATNTRRSLWIWCNASLYIYIYIFSLRQSSECDLNAGHDLVMEWDAKLIQSSFIRTVSHRTQSSANLCGAVTIHREIWGGRFPAPYI